MLNKSYTRDRTALLFVDPYNDFPSEGGKLWPLVDDVAREVELLDNLRTITAAIRKADIRIFIVPHHRWSPATMKAGTIRTRTRSLRARGTFFAKG